MAEKPLMELLPADLPENWTAGQIVAPTGEEVGLSKQHGYNYLMQMVNRAQRGVNTVNEAIEEVSGKRTCRFVVGTSTSGWTAADCDFLCDGADDQVEIQKAIDLIPQNEFGEIVILDGWYHLTDAITVKSQVKICGKGHTNTILLREAASVGTAGTKNAIIFLDYQNELLDLAVLSLVDAPDAAQIYVDRGAQIRRVNINGQTYPSTAPYMPKVNVGIGIYFNRSYVESKYVSDCILGNVSTAVYLSETNNVYIMNCSAPAGTFSENNEPSTARYPEFFIQSKSVNDVFVCGNKFLWSAVKIDAGTRNILIGNTFARLKITRSDLAASAVLYGNLAANNILAPLTGSEAGIFLGEGAAGWFITGNHVRNVSTGDEYWPIVDNGVNNNVRFNSNNTGSGGEGGAAGVSSFKGRTGAVAPASGDYTAAMVGARPSTWVPSAADVGAIPAGDVTGMAVLTESAYNALSTKVPTVLYLITE